MTQPYAVRDDTVDGHAAVTLASPGAALEATFVPAAGMIGCSLRHRGAELLGQRGGLAKYVASGSTMGIPLLHPWANRLSAETYRCGGQDVTIDPCTPRLHHDSAGLLMHGLLLAYPGWRVVHRDADTTGARFEALLDFAADPALLAAFPFPHTLRLKIALRGTRLGVTTVLRPTGDRAVPVAFGFHPYLQLPGLPRDAWHVEIPVERRLLLDGRGLPTGASEAIAIEPGPLGTRAFDDLYTDLPVPAHFVLAGAGRRITLTFEAGYPFAQVYAPDTDALICFEPMTAPTNALVSGDGLRWVEPGQEFRAAFAVSVEEMG